MNPLPRKPLAGLRLLVALLSWCGIVMPAAPTLAQESNPQSIPIVDVALAEDNSLHGTVVSADGHAQQKTKIELRNMSGEIISTKTDRDGRFQFSLAGGGSYQLSTPHSNYFCRIWTHRAAPPAAVSELLVVSDARIARAQRPFSELFIKDPIWICAAVAAAVIIPIAIHNSGDDRDAGS